MAGISSKALSFGNPGNKKKYQQYEFNGDFDINLYDSFYRTHDPQLGRFWQIDPKPTDFESLYAAMGNNPINKTDFLGDTLYDKRNKPITYTVQKDGTLKWSKNVTKEWKRIGNGLAKTQNGLEQLNKARDAKWGITLTFSKNKSATEYGSTTNDAKNEWDGVKKEATIKVMHITLSEGKMKSDFNGIRNGKLDFGGGQDGLYEYLYKQNAFESAFIANAGHEIIHAADEKNIQDSWKNFKLGEKNDLEAVPEATETKILEDAVFRIKFSKMFIK